MGMLPLKHLTPKILMAVNYYWQQLSQRLAWVTPAYLKEKGANPHHGGCKHSLQYDSRPDWCFWVQVGMWNTGSLFVSFLLTIYLNNVHLMGCMEFVTIQDISRVLFISSFTHIPLYNNHVL